MSSLSLDTIKVVNFRKEIKYDDTKKIHNLFRYPAKLIPEIACAYLNKKYIKPEGTVFDPFCGSGTVLIESRKRNYNSIGSDINPLAILISKVKTTNLDWLLVEERLKNFDKEVRKFKPSDTVFRNINYWFRKKHIKNLSRIRNWIYAISNKDIKDFFLFVFASIIRESSNADPKIYPPTFSKRMKLKSKEIKKIDVLKVFLEKANKSKITLSEYFEKYTNKSSTKCILGSATESMLPDKSVDLVITSPPYINAQKYTRTTKLELFWLGFYNDTSLVELSSNMIGTEKISTIEFQIEDLVGKPWEKYVNNLLLIDEWRSRIVHKYFLEMEKAIFRIFKCLKKDGYFILIIGNNSIRGERIRNDLILTKIAQSTGFSLRSEECGKDKIKKRSLPEQRNKTASFMEYEFVLVFKK